MLLTSYIQTLFPKVLGNTIDILKVNNFDPKSVYVNIGYIMLIAFGNICNQLCMEKSDNWKCTKFGMLS